MFHRDAVHSIFAFLSLRDLASAANSCVEWRCWAASAPRAPSGSITIHLRNCGWLFNNLMNPAAEPGNHSSKLARHLGTLRIVPAQPLLPLLQSLRALPNLTRLKFVWGSLPLSLSALPADLAAHSLPTKLVELHIGISDRPTIREQSAVFGVCVALAARCCPCLRKLVLTNPQTQGAELRFDVTPLAALPELEDVTFEIQPSIALVHALGAIRTLKAIRFPSSEPVDDPAPFLFGHSMHAFQQLQVRSQPLTGGQLRRLAALAPTLTALPQCDLHFSGVAALPLFPHLTSLQLTLVEAAYDPALDWRVEGDWQTFRRADEFIPLLLQCSCLPQLTRLSLSSIALLTPDLSTKLFDQLSAVRILELDSVHLCSLACLQSMPHIEQLSLTTCSQNLTRSDLRYVERLPALLHLHVMEGTCKLILPADVERLSVPSAALPRLQCFHYWGRPNAATPSIRVETPSFCQRTLPLQHQSFEEPEHCVL